jgi:hypothetical protein
MDDARNAQLEDTTNTISRGDIIRAHKKKTRHKGTAGTISDEMQQTLMQFYENLRENGNVVTPTMIAIELCRQYPEMGADLPFRTVMLRVRRFLASKGLVTRRITHAAQNHTYNQERMDNFVGYVNRQIQCNKYIADCIVNFDQTNIDFDIAASTTLENRGRRSISIKNTGSSKRCTVLLAVTLSGVKLPPFIIFEGQPGDRSRIRREFKDPKFGYPQSNFYTVQPKAWDDQNTHMQWVEKVWFPFCDQQQNGNYTYLIHDEFKVHLMGKVIWHKQELGTEVEFIPGGYTGALQVLDKGIIKPFKDHYHSQQLQWQINNYENNKPKKQDVAKWIEAAWEKVTVESIKNTWASIGIKAWEPLAQQA